MILKNVSPVFLLIAFFGFFLPFTDITCNEKKLDTIKGIELVVGYTQDLDITTGSGETTNETSERYDPNIFALNAFLAAIIGIFLFAVKKFRTGYLLQALISTIGFICMLGLMIDLKTKIAEAQNGDNSKLNFDLNLDFEMKLGYWLVTFCFFVAGVFQFMLFRKQKSENINLFPDQDSTNELDINNKGGENSPPLS